MHIYDRSADVVRKYRHIMHLTHSVITSLLRFVIKSVSCMHAVTSMFSDSLKMFVDDYC